MMIKIFQIIVICYAFLVLFVSFDSSEANNEPKRAYHRQRRYLSFGNVSHFFIRFNFKANMVPWNQIFAQAVGFRMNWDEPPDSFHPYHHLYRRTVYTHLETLLDRNGLQGFHCVRRAICEMDRISKPKGIYYKVLKMVFSLCDSIKLLRITEPVEMLSFHELDIFHELDQYAQRSAKHVLQISPSTDKWHNKTEEDCTTSIGACPFSMLEVSTYTDF